MQGKATCIFLDTEFTSLKFLESAKPGALPDVLSVGMVSDDGLEFYGELLTSASLRASCSDFVRDVVLPQFGRAGAAYLTKFELACRAADFLTTVPGLIEVVYDHVVDFDLLLSLLDEADPDARGRISSGVLWVPPSDRVTLACPNRDASFARSATDGLLAHHALADARALRAEVLSGDAASAQAHTYHPGLGD